MDQLVGFPLLLVLKPVSAFRHPNPLPFQLFIYIISTCYTIYKCKQSYFINVSHTDKLRGIMPCIYSIFYCIHYYFHYNNIHSLLSIFTFLTLFWGIHHTLILWQRNYLSVSHDKEDYRWTAIRTNFGPPWQWQLFTIIFINIYHQFIYFSIVNCPYYLIYNTDNTANITLFTSTNHSTSNVNININIIFICLWCIFFIYLCMADYQMYLFQKYKKSEAISGKYLRHTNKDEFITVDGTFNGWKWDFIDTGLWKYSRHPNYFAEITIWFIIALVAIINSANTNLDHNKTCNDNIGDNLNTTYGIELSDLDILTVIGNVGSVVNASVESVENVAGIVVRVIDPIKIIVSLLGVANLWWFMYKLACITDGICDIKYPCYQWKIATTNMLIPWIPQDRSEVIKNTSKEVTSADVEELYIYS